MENLKVVEAVGIEMVDGLLRGDGLTNGPERYTIV